MLKIYIIGVVITFLSLILTEHFYYGAGSATSVKGKDIIEDAAVSSLSWLGLILVAIFYIGEYMTNFNMYGYGKELEEFEDELKDVTKDDE